MQSKLLEYAPNIVNLKFCPEKKNPSSFDFNVKHGSEFRRFLTPEKKMFLLMNYKVRVYGNSKEVFVSSTLKF